MYNNDDIIDLIYHYEQSLANETSDTHSSVDEEYDALISVIMQESACASLPHGDEIAARLWSIITCHSPPTCRGGW